MSQSQLAGKLWLDRSSISGYEIGKRMPDILILILSILVYTLFSRMFDLMQPPAVKHSIAVV
ncbi:helix-turn-helix domain-containing protein, partial [Dorea ammoniilytica]